MRRFALHTLVLLVSTLSLLIPPSLADYSIRLGEDGISVAISADFTQGIPNKYSNITRIFKEIPVFTLGLEGDNSSMIAVPLNEAIKSKSPGSSASQVQFSANSNGTWMHYDLSFRVQGLSTNNQGVSKSDLAWRSLVISTDIVVAAYSINRLLPTYVGDEIIGLTQEPGGVPIQQSRSWYFNGRFRSGPQIVAAVPGMILFNFTSLSRPLEDWVAARDLENLVTTWRASTGFNLTFIGRLEDPEAVLLFARTAIYNLETVIQAPGFAEASGDLILYESTGSYGDVLMGFTIVTSVLLFVGAVVMERRYQSPRGRFKKAKR